jgi:hypothetical protein
MSRTEKSLIAALVLLAALVIGLLVLVLTDLRRAVAVFAPVSISVHGAQLPGSRPTHDGPRLPGSRPTHDGPLSILPPTLPPLALNNSGDRVELDPDMIVFPAIEDYYVEPGQPGDADPALLGYPTPLPVGGYVVPGSPGIPTTGSTAPPRPVRTPDAGRPPHVTVGAPSGWSLLLVGLTGLLCYWRRA